MFQRVAVIGAGPSGVTSIKGCLDEGLEPTCFESSDDIGGLWRFKEKPEPGRANIYKSVIINSSKEMMSFSDFPPPADLSNNMHHSEVLLHLRLYAQTFNLLPHIRFQTTVISVRQTTNFEVPGQWEVETESREGQRETRVFDAVMVCTGHFTQPHLPLRDFPGIESFRAKYFHSWEYCSAEGLEGKRVVVIGIGNSGGDIAVDVSRVAEKVYLSTRSGAWVVGRVGPGGLPLDVVGSSRMDALIRKLFPSWTNTMLEKKLNPQTIWPETETWVKAWEFCGSTVVWSLVFAYSFPFLPSALQAKCGYRLQLYKHVFPPALTSPTLAVVGFIHGFGAINPLAEMQACWATRVLVNICFFSVICYFFICFSVRFACSERNPLQVHDIPYMDSLSEEVGVRPNIPWLFFKDPTLALQVFLGPCTPYQYHLTGPGKWAGARQAILTQWDRVFQPFKTRVVTEPKPDIKHSSKLSIIMFLSGAKLFLQLGLAVNFFSPSFLILPVPSFISLLTGFPLLF
uniref:Flavin-containing monooxygenase n=1 Tax=Pundamilia nyererei TaxID=303518 RepID=A0A3B4FIU2_9CICH